VSLLLQTPRAVTFTNMRFGVVQTPMLATSGQHYRGLPSLTADEAAVRVVRALEDRPVSWNITAGRAGDVLNLVAPRLADYVMHRSDRAGRSSG
jgi:hypothetical protein